MLFYQYYNNICYDLDYYNMLRLSSFNKSIKQSKFINYKISLPEFTLKQYIINYIVCLNYTRI